MKNRNKKTGFFSNPVSVASLIIFTVLLLSCLLAPLICAYPPTLMDIPAAFSGMSAAHPLGTDNLGRDLLTRLLYGGQNTFRITGVALLIAMLGIIPGVLVGYSGGVQERIVPRIFDAVAAVPVLLMAVFVESAAESGKGAYMYAMGIGFMPGFFRMARSLTQSVADREFIDAAKALGVSKLAIIRDHILKNILPSLAVYAAGTAAEILVMCTLIGYMGIGVASPQAEWGAIAAEYYGYLRSRPLLIISPSVFICIASLSLYLIGNGLRDALDRRKR